MSNFIEKNIIEKRILMYPVARQKQKAMEIKILIDQCMMFLLQIFGHRQADQAEDIARVRIYGQKSAIFNEFGFGVL
jgi:hypothetical protein